MASLIYMIEEEGGPIKIGIAADPRARLLQLQTGNPRRLSLMAACPGDEVSERALHHLFDEHRIRGEWFQRVAAIERAATRLDRVIFEAREALHEHTADLTDPGAIVRSLRRRSAWTLREMAESLELVHPKPSGNDWTPQDIAKMESGHRNMDGPILVALLTLLNASVDQRRRAVAGLFGVGVPELIHALRGAEGAA